MAQLTKGVSGKQLVRLFSGCYLLETTANEVGYCLNDKRGYASFSGANSGGVNRSFYVEVSEGYLVLSESSDYYLKQLPQAFQRFKFDKIS